MAQRTPDAVPDPWAKPQLPGWRPTPNSQSATNYGQAGICGSKAHPASGTIVAEKTPLVPSVKTRLNASVPSFDRPPGKSPPKPS